MNQTSDTDVSELDPSEGDRITDNPPSLEQQLGTLAASLGEANALSILSREASERCANLCTQVLARLAEGDKLFREQARFNANVRARLDRLEERAGLPPLES